MLTPTYVLGLTLLADAVDKLSSTIKVADTTGLTPGTRLFVDRELMSVVSLGVSPYVNVKRGVDGTLATRHANGAFTIYGSADQFYSVDPQGAPPVPVLVLPYINIRTGDVFVPLGDEAGNGPRWWEKARATYVQGALGAWQVKYEPTTLFS